MGGWKSVLSVAYDCLMSELGRSGSGLMYH